MPPYFGKARRATAVVLAVTAVVATGQLLTAGPAHAAGQVSIVGSTMQFLADPGDDNAVNVTVVGANYRITDTNPVAAAFPCVGIVNGADCPIASVTALQVQLGDLSDSVQNLTALPSSLYGEAGSDYLLGGSRDDYLSGGADNDTLDGSRGDDSMSGSTGIDWVYYTTRNTTVMVTLNSVAGDGEVAIGENDNVSSTVENAYGGAGSDHLVGNTAVNILNGNNGSDHLYGGAGNDDLNGQGGARDVMYGEAGADDLDGGNDAGDSGDGDWNQDNVNDDAMADTCSAATEVQYSC